MPFTKNKAMALTAILVVVALYNLAVFLIPFERGNSFWVSYAATMISMVIATAVGLYAIGRGNIVRRFYGASLVVLVLIYFVLQLALGLLTMLLPMMPQYITILANASLLGCFIIALMGASIAKNVVEGADTKTKTKTLFIKSLQADIESLASRATDTNAKKALTVLAVAVKFSDPMSNPQLADAENDIRAKVLILTESLDDTVKVNALCDELQRMLEERNRKCKLMK